MQAVFAFVIILLISTTLSAGEKLKRFNHEICNSKTSQLLFYDKLVYSIKKTRKSKTFSPLGVIGKERIESSEIWQTSAPLRHSSTEQYFVNSGYSLLKHKTGLYLIEGQTAVIPKAKCQFSNNESHFQPWNCLARLQDLSGKTVNIKIKSNRKKIDIVINKDKLQYKNPGILKAGITARSETSAMIWFNEKSVFVTVGYLRKFNDCKKAQNKDYPKYITDQIMGGDES